MKKVKSYLKYLFALALKQGGAFKPASINRKLRKLGGVLVPAYHSVRDIPNGNPALAGSPYSVNAGTFEKQIATYKKYFVPIHLRELESRVENQQNLPENSCLITFDDGWEDNSTVVYPLMRNAGLPGAIFLATGLVGTNHLYWTHHLWHLLRTAPAELSDLRSGLTEISNRLTPDFLIAKNGLIKAATNIFEMIGRMDPSSRKLTIDQIVKRNRGYIKNRWPERFYMPWNSIQEIDTDILDFGSHAHTHDPLTWWDDKSLANELAKSKEIIEARLGKNIKSLSFPHSKSGFREENAAAKAGYRIVFTGNDYINDAGVERSGIHIFARIGISEETGRTPLGRFSESLFLFNMFRQAGAYK
jgi:peptidoglycan/xylan/chitin deacetylase (PgdA/CDA1 family)